MEANMHKSKMIWGPYLTPGEFWGHYTELLAEMIRALDSFACGVNSKIGRRRLGLCNSGRILAERSQNRQQTKKGYAEVRNPWVF
jgi:hypothetical protein